MAWQVIEGIGSGLAALHNKGIVHRDLKPQNVLLTSTMQAKLSDMGFCKRLGPGQSSFESTGYGESQLCHHDQEPHQLLVFV